MLLLSRSAPLPQGRHGTAWPDEQRCIRLRTDHGSPPEIGPLTFNLASHAVQSMQRQQYMISRVRDLL